MGTHAVVKLLCFICLIQVTKAFGVPQIFSNQKPPSSTDDDGIGQNRLNSEDCMDRLKKVKAGEIVGVITSSAKSASDVVMYCFTECVNIVKHMIGMVTMTVADVTELGQQRAKEMQAEPGSNKDFITCFIACIKRLAEAVKNGTFQVIAALYKQ